jgi:serine/threonine-protein kinase SRK2
LPPTLPRLTYQIYDHPWYCKNLPPGVKEMNDHPQPPPQGLQSQEEIVRIVAVSVGGACALSGAGLS